MRVAIAGATLLALGVAGVASCATTAPTVAAESARPGQVIKDCADCPEVVVIPAGAFVMGADQEEREHEGVLNNAAREQPRHAVSIDRSFGIGRTEVTRAQYGRFAEDTRRSGPPECAAPGSPEAATAASVPVTKSWKNPGYVQSDLEPAVCVSWDDAKAYVAWLSQKTGKIYRLPTEAEWEYAARAGTSTARYWGDAPKSICHKANVLTMATLQASPAGASRDELVCNSDHKFTTPVASFDANPFGLYDMIGNVLEAVEDCFHPNYDGAPTDGSSWRESTCQGRILRGGSFNNLPWFARAAFRATVAPDHRGIETGLRVARDLEGATAR